MRADRSVSHRHDATAARSASICSQPRRRKSVSVHAAISPGWMARRSIAGSTSDGPANRTGMLVGEEDRKRAAQTVRHDIERSLADGRHDGVDGGREGGQGVVEVVWPVAAAMARKVDDQRATAQPRGRVGPRGGPVASPTVEIHDGIASPAMSIQRTESPPEVNGALSASSSVLLVSRPWAEWSACERTSGNRFLKKSRKFGKAVSQIPSAS